MEPSLAEYQLPEPRPANDYLLDAELADYSALVSVVITNYNYGMYIGMAVRSVFAQSYKNIECIIVDDYSTDNSIEIIEDLQKTYPDLGLFRNDANRGQSISMLNGFNATRGPFVIFLDADDYLLPTCVETHVSAHLSSRFCVGFTSVDMVQLLDLDMVSLTSHGFSNHVRSKKGLVPGLLRDRVKLPNLSSKPLRADEVHYVQPKDSIHWPWSPTSGNCFRRDALSLVIHNDGLRTLRSCSDIYLLRSVGILTGSIIIDRPLAVYRIHGNNDFVRGATLHQIRIFNPSYLAPRSNIAVELILKLLIEKSDFFVDRLESPHFLADAIATADRIWPPLPKSKFYVSKVVKLILQHRKRLRKAIGYRRYADLLAQSTFKNWRTADIGPSIVALVIIVFVAPVLLILVKFDDWYEDRERASRA